MPNQDPEIFDVFLSHSHQDASIVEELAVRLADEAGLHVWLDKWVLVPGGLWQQEMAGGLNQANSCAVCIGAETPSGWFDQEIQLSLDRQVGDPTFRVIPVLLPDAQKVNVEGFVKLRTWVDFQKGLANARAFHELVAGIRGEAPGRGPEEEIVDEQFSAVRRGLQQLKELGDLVENEVRLDFQRQLVSQLIQRS